jgi:uncharacterized protein (TIGR03437 family)
LSTLQPALQQPFFIGSGKLPGGGNRAITIPLGTTRMFVGIADSGLASYRGSFTLNISSGAANCTYNVSPLTQTFPATGGSGTLSVGSVAGCSWTATSTVAWISLTSETSGNGNGTVNYSVQANETSSDRTAALTIAGQSVNISQAAPSQQQGLGANPASLSFDVTVGSAAPVGQIVQAVGSSSGAFTLGVISDSWLAVTPTGGVLPAVLNVFVNPRDLTAGTYKSAIPILSAGSSVQIPVTVNMHAGSPDSLTVSSPNLQFNVTGDTAHDSSATTSIFSVTSAAPSTVAVRFSKEQNSSWMDISPVSADVSPGQSIDVTVRISPSGFPVGSQVSDKIVVTSGNTVKQLPVVVTVSAGQDALPLVSLSAISLYTKPGQNSFDKRTTLLYNAGPGALDWAAVRNDNVITVDPTFDSVLQAGNFSTTADALTGPNPPLTTKVNLSLNGRRLAIPVTIQQTDTIPPRLVQAAVIVGVPGQGLQQVQINHSENQPLTFSIKKPDWLSVTYTGYPNVPPTLPPGTPPPPFILNIDVADASKVTIGQSETVTLTFDNYPKNGARHVLNVGVVVGGVQVSSTAIRVRPSLAGCVPSGFTAAFLNPPNLFTVPARLPVAVEAKVVDNCGTVLRTGAATVSFSSGDSALALAAFPDGVWRGTWQPAASPQGLVVLKLTATSSAGSGFGRSLVYGTVTANSAAPIVQSGSVLNAASFQRWGDVLVPGQIVSIFGEGLARGPATANGSPATSLGGVQVSLDGAPIPLFAVAPTQINAMIPFTASTGQVSQLVVERDGIPSVPLPVVIVAARPGIFSTSLTGSGQGIITNLAGKIVDAGVPASRGDTVTVWCTGLGQVDTSIGAGTAAPSSPPANVKARTSVLVGNSSAEVQFSGLTPGLFGLYQVNFRVPQSAPSGASVPVALTVNGVDSNIVTIAIR